MSRAVTPLRYSAALPSLLRDFTSTFVLAFSLKFFLVLVFLRYVFFFYYYVDTTKYYFVFLLSQFLMTFAARPVPIRVSLRRRSRDLIHEVGPLSTVRQPLFAIVDCG